MNSENTNPTSSASAATVLDRPQTALRFRFIGGQRHGQVIRIAANKCTIGSSEEATFRLKCAGVHAVHCLILRGEGGTAIKRLGDDTLLNGEAFEDAQLSEGDRLTIGPLEFEVLGEAAANTTGNQPSSQERAAFEAQRAEWERQRDQEQQDLETRRQELEQQAQAIEEDRQAIQAQTEENQQSEEAQEEVAQLRAQLEQAEAERNEVSQLREQLEQSETQRTEAEQQWNQTREELQSELESLKSETQDNSNEEEIAELRTQCEELTRQLEEASQQQQSQTDWTALQATWDTERSQFQTDLDSAQLQISELTQRCTQAEESANDTSFAESMSALEARLTEVEAAREQDREEFEASQQRDREELATAQEQLDSMRAEVERLEAERAAAQAEPAPAAFAPEAPSYENYAEQPGFEQPQAEAGFEQPGFEQSPAEPSFEQTQADPAFEQPATYEQQPSFEQQQSFAQQETFEQQDNFQQPTYESEPAAAYNPGPASLEQPGTPQPEFAAPEYESTPDFASAPQESFEQPEAESFQPASEHAATIDPAFAQATSDNLDDEASYNQSTPPGDRTMAMDMLNRLRQEVSRAEEDADRPSLLDDLQSADEPVQPQPEEAVAFAEQPQESFQETRPQEAQPEPPTAEEELVFSTPQSEAPVDTAAILAKFGHTMEEDDDVAPSPSQTIEVPPVAESPNATVVSEAPTPNNEDESIDDYMQQLMQRVGGGSYEKPEPTQPAVTEPVAMPTEPVQTQAAPQREATMPLDPKEFVPRAVAPEASSNLRALRAVANTSSRSAIDKAQRRTLVRNAWVFWFVAAMAAIVGVAMGFFAKEIVSMPSAVSLVAFLISFLTAVKALAFNARAKLGARSTQKQLAASIEQVK